MTFDKDTVLEFLRSNGQHEQADQAAQEPPGQVDTDQHSDLLGKFGVNPADLIAKFTGGSPGASGARGPLGGIVGKLL